MIFLSIHLNLKKNKRVILSAISALSFMVGCVGTGPNSDHERKIAELEAKSENIRSLLEEGEGAKKKSDDDAQDFRLAADRAEQERNQANDQARIAHEERIKADANLAAEQSARLAVEQNTSLAQAQVKAQRAKEVENFANELSQLKDHELKDAYEAVRKAEFDSAELRRRLISLETDLQLEQYKKSILLDESPEVAEKNILELAIQYSEYIDNIKEKIVELQRRQEEEKLKLFHGNIYDVTKIKKQLDATRALGEIEFTLLQLDADAENFQAQIGKIENEKNAEVSPEKAWSQATKTLSGRTLGQYYSFLYYTDLSTKGNYNACNIQSESLIRLFLKGAKNPANYCKAEIEKLTKDHSNDKWTATRLIPIFESVCIDFVFLDKTHRGEAFLKTILKLQKYSEPQKNFKELVAKLESTHPNQKQRIWDVKPTLLKKNDWLISTPEYLDYPRTQISPEHHSDRFIKTWGDAIAQAEKFVDVTTLSVPDELFGPDGKIQVDTGFMGELHQSILKLDQKKSPIIVRILFGVDWAAMVQRVNTREVLEKISQGLSQDSKLTISVGTYDATTDGGTWLKTWPSWNHSKIVAVDGKMMLTGGHNLYRSYLLPTGPLSTGPMNNAVSDVSALIYGELALVGHRFANLMWQYVEQEWRVSHQVFLGYTHRKFAIHTFRQGASPHSIIGDEAPGVLIPKSRVFPKDVIPEQFDDSHPTHHRSAFREATDSDHIEDVIAVGRLRNAVAVASGLKTNESVNVSDTAILNIIDQAKVGLFISQQAVLELYAHKWGPFHSYGWANFTVAVVKSLVKAIDRGVDVYILTSSNAESLVGVGEFGYTSKYSRENFFKTLIKKSNKKLTSERLEKMLNHFHLLYTANGEHEIPNHAKVVVADGQVGYIGSHNLYDDSHAEFGIIVGPFGSQQILTHYFAPMWYSSLTSPLQSIHQSHQNLVQNDFVFVLRREDKASKNQQWTLARIFNKKSKEKIQVDMDFLIRDGVHEIQEFKLDQVRLTPFADRAR